MKKNEIVSAAGEMGSEAVQPAAKRHDWLAKAVCLLLACVIWLYVMLVDSPDHEETFHSVDIELINTSILEDEHSLSVYSGYGNVVDVTVVGKKSDISRMSAEDIRITADVSQIGEAGTHTLTLSADLPAGLSLGALSQNSVQVYCDEKSSKVVNVRARLVSFVSEYSIGSLEPEYDTVVVSGPKETLDQIAERVRAFRLALRTQWMRENKAFGFDVMDIRIGGVLAQLDTAKYRLAAYLNGEVDRLEELEAERLPYIFDGNGPEDEKILRINRWERMAAQNISNMY